ncbi:MAG: LysR family transcriptional regulator [Polyangiales bacterium]
MATLRESLDLNRLVYFAAVVDAGSFTLAAERLGVTKSVVSQQITRLEKEVGATLLLRTTRRVTATEAGKALHARCVVILKESAEAFDELAQGTAEPSGTLRLTAPLDYGATVVVPVVAAFLRAHPGCTVELSLGDRMVDVQTVDVAIRVGWLRDSSHVVRRIGAMEQCVVGSPELARLREPADLAALPFVANHSLSEPDHFRFTHPKHGSRSVRLRPRLWVDTTPAAHAAVLAGAGISVLPDYVVDADLAAGRLVRLLPEWALRSGGIHAVLPSARFRPAKVTRFLEAMSQAEAARARGRGAGAPSGRGRR